MTIPLYILFGLMTYLSVGALVLMGGNAIQKNKHDRISKPGEIAVFLAIWPLFFIFIAIVGIGDGAKYLWKKLTFRLSVTASVMGEKIRKVVLNLKNSYSKG